MAHSINPGGNTSSNRCLYVNVQVAKPSNRHNATRVYVQSVRRQLRSCKPLTFNELKSGLPPLATKEEDAVNKTSAVRQVLEVILRQLTNTRISP